MAYEYKIVREVEFSDTDMAGIMHFSNFFRFMEAAEHGFFRSLGLSISYDTSGAAGLAARACRLRFPLSAPVRGFGRSQAAGTREAGEEPRLFVHLSQDQRRSTTGSCARNAGGSLREAGQRDRKDDRRSHSQGDRRQDRSRAAGGFGCMTPSARCSLDRSAIEAHQIEKLQLL